MSELRYHPFLGQWVITATQRQDRTFHPPADFCPLCPTRPSAFPTEIPFDDYDIVVFENKFPSLQRNPPEPAVGGQVRKSEGACEVVCYSSDHHATFATLPLSQIRKLMRVWRERTCELSERPEVEYVFIFENKGREIGVTLSHPHGQIYAYPFIPPVLGIELENEKVHFESTGRSLFDDWLSAESADREVCRNESFVAMVPFFARYPYEVHVVATSEIPSLRKTSDAELDHLAAILHEVAQRLDGLFGFSMPYVMAVHQEPAVPGYEFTRLHVEFYPPYRTADKLKYLAGSEAGAGAFINDTLPEESAARLRAVTL
ncbi:MAG TPA: galactose-1-phosphate uridylyltransferase [Fimbriimonadaceae bacterium]|nr:galactose-1-phosphate uridylyltransferase [Fimbriimonadaceae bacterium]